MRICFVTYPSHPNAQRWLRYFAQDLGHDVHVIAFGKDHEPTPGVTIHAIDCGDIRQKWRYLTTIPAVRRLVQRIAPEILVGYRVQSHGFVAAWAGFHPFVLAAQDEHIVNPPDSRWLRWCCRFAVSRADWFNAWGPHMAEAFLGLGAPAHKIALRPRGARLDVFYPPPEAHPPGAGERGSGPPTLCVTRGLRRDYRHDVLIDAMPAVLREVPDARLIVAGRGPQEAEIRARVARLGLERHVVMPGYYDEKGVATLLRASDVYVSAFPTDGVSASLMEAMATGCFPVVPDVRPNRPWVESGVNGFLFAPNDPADLSCKLVAALRDAPLRRRAAPLNIEKARADANWEKNMRLIEAEYLALIDAHARGASRHTAVGTRAAQTA